MYREKSQRFFKLSLPPLITAILVLAVFAFDGMYPFGEKSIAWSDAVDQFIPLVTNFKEVLEGQTSLFLNFKYSGGSNFYGPFLFLLSSPFSFLVKFVAKENIIEFFNILVMLKMVTIAFTAAYCLATLRQKLETFWVVLLSLTYAFCGYVMMYYLIIGWLDLVYLFPLLIVGLDRLIKERKPLMYIVVLALCCLFNYYITYMLGIFILLFMGGYLLFNYKEEDCSRVCRQILLGSFLAFLVTAVFWLPSFMQYRDSARGESTIVETIASKNLFFNRYETSLPLLMAQALPFVLILGDLCKRRKRSKENNLYLSLLGLTIIPFVCEPINLLWHTGSYMCFPCRFSFITIFLALFCSAYTLEEEEGEEAQSYSKLATYGSLIIGFMVIDGTSWLIFTILNNHSSEMSRYFGNLWNDGQSFKYLSYIFVIIFALYSLTYWIHSKKYISKYLFFIFLSCIFLWEIFVKVDIGFIECARNHESSNQQKIEGYDLVDKIEDGDFYRVKPCQLFHNDNYIGSLGYNSISGYTSLNERNYMKMMKNLGYSGYWMKVSSHGGTELTDAILCVKYAINGDQDKEEIYRSFAGSIKRLPYSLPMGLYLKKGALKKAKFLPSNFERADIQRFIAEHILNDNIIKKYSPEEEFKKEKKVYKIKKGTVVNYKIKIEGKQSLYLDLYNGFSIKFKNPLYRAVEVIVNDKRLEDGYPNKNSNSLLYLGTYKDETVKVNLRFQKKVKCKSFGLFGLDVVKLQEFCTKAQGANLNVKGSGLYAKCQTPKDCSLLVSLPYSDNFTIKVNGKKVKYKRAFSDLIVFDLPKGENEISITFVPKGFVLGAIISCLGLILSGLYVKFASKLEEKIGADKVTKVIAGTISAVVVLGVYILPVLVKLFH